jgi:hypothetical protein
VGQVQSSDWVKFEYVQPKGETRPESCRVYEDRLEVERPLDKRERARLLNPLILPSTHEATARGMSLTLIRPISAKFQYRRKSPNLIVAERDGYRATLRQTSFLDEDLEPIEPVPYLFAFSYADASGKHTMQCSDWETSATFWRLRFMVSKARSTTCPGPTTKNIPKGGRRSPWELSGRGQSNGCSWG